MLRLPSKLELTFYDELLAPHILAALLRPDESGTLQRRLTAQHFYSEAARFGYVLTKSGCVMKKVEPDILDIELGAFSRVIVAADMEIFDRLKAKSR